VVVVVDFNFKQRFVWSVYNMVRHVYLLLCSHVYVPVKWWEKNVESFYGFYRHKVPSMPFWPYYYYAIVYLLPLLVRVQFERFFKQRMAVLYVIHNAEHNFASFIIFCCLRLMIRWTASHAIHLQFDIGVNALVLRAVQSPKCIF
jgi:hypothetical protein